MSDNNMTVDSSMTAAKVTSKKQFQILLNEDVLSIIVSFVNSKHDVCSLVAVNKLFNKLSVRDTYWNAILHDPCNEEEVFHQRLLCQNYSRGEELFREKVNTRQAYIVYKKRILQEERKKLWTNFKRIEADRSSCSCLMMPWYGFLEAVGAIKQPE